MRSGPSKKLRCRPGSSTVLACRNCTPIVVLPVPVEPITTEELAIGRPLMASCASSDGMPLVVTSSRIVSMDALRYSDSMRGNTVMPSLSMRSECLPRSGPAPRNLRTWIDRSERASNSLSSSSIRPSTIVCSAAMRWMLPLVSSSTVQSCSTAMLCSSWTNFFRSRSLAPSEAATSPSSTSTPTLRVRISRRSTFIRPFRPELSRSWKALM